MRPIFFPSDPALVHKVRQGDQQAFNRLVDRHGARVYFLLRRLTNNTDTAEDLTQETFVAAYAAIDSWRGEGAFSTWLCGIAVIRYRLANRKQYQSPFVDRLEEKDNEMVSIPNDDPLAHYKRREADAALADAIASLPENCREVFVLVRVEEMPYQNVADLLEIPLGTVQSRLNRATRFLHERLAPLIYGSETIPLTHSPKGYKHDVR